VCVCVCVCVCGVLNSAMYQCHLPKGRRAVRFVLAPVGFAALCATVVGIETARAALDLSQHSVALQANIAPRLVRGPVLQLALLVAKPYTATSSAPLHLLIVPH
jgi:hypothetical protein